MVVTIKGIVELMLASDYLRLSDPFKLTTQLQSGKTNAFHEAITL